VKKVLPKIGFICFIVGLVLAIVFGIVSPSNSSVILALVILGLVVGFLNVTSKEVMTLLLAVVALVVVGGVFEPLKALGIGSVLNNILKMIAIFMAPAAVVVAIKALWKVGFPGEKE
jgi:hypothetical protein